MTTMLITYEQWQKMVDKWIQNYDRLLEGFNIEKAPCELCSSMLAATRSFMGTAADCLALCPAAPEMCMMHNIHPAPVYYQALSCEYNMEDHKRAVLEILQWLHDFGKIARWRY